MATKKEAEKKLTVTQVKSAIGEKPAARRTLRALGLNKIGSQAQHVDVPTIRGMVRSVMHLVTVEEGK